MRNNALISGIPKNKRTINNPRKHENDYESLWFPKKYSASLQIKILIYESLKNYRILRNSDHPFVGKENVPTIFSKKKNSALKVYIKLSELLKFN